MDDLTVFLNLVVPLTVKMSVTKFFTFVSKPFVIRA